MQDIDVKSIFQNKNPKLAKRVPSFIFSLISRVLHINEINHIGREYGDLPGSEWMDEMAKYFRLNITTNGEENIPKEGKFIFASNHPLGALDGIFLLREIARLKGDSKFLVNDILLNIIPLKPYFIPINKHGNQRDSAHLIDEAYRSDSQVLIFPYGLASRKRGGVIEDLVWHKHVILKSRQHQRDVIPVYIEARNSRRFYMVSRLRKLLRLKINIEMFLLPSEMFRQKGKSISITFGEPVPHTQFTKERRPSDWAEWLRKRAYSLRTR